MEITIITAILNEFNLGSLCALCGIDFSVTRLGNFWKFSGTNFRSKVAKMFGNILGNLENQNFLIQTAVAKLRATFEIIGQLFIPTSGHILQCDNIWQNYNNYFLPNKLQKMPK